MASTVPTSLNIIGSGLADAKLQPPKGNPDVNQFLKVVQKTTRWAAQWNRVEFDGTPEFGQRVSMTLPRIGELVSGFNIVVTMPDIYTKQIQAIQASGGTDLKNVGNFLGPTYGWTNSLGHALIQQIDLEIGGAIVETFTSQQLEILDELYETVESAIAKNAMIKRAPHGFNAKTWLSATPTTVYIPIPFWFSRPGVYSHALPIEALKSDIVRVHVTFRPIAELFYTDARVDSRTVGYRPDTDTGVMWGIQSGRFWRKNPASPNSVYTMNASMIRHNPIGAVIPIGISGELIPNITFPQRFSPIDAYALVEYISLDDYEALVFRTAELTYHVEQHLALPVHPTQGQTEMRMSIPFTNPTKEIMWVAQRPEVANYNAWFLFTRDLSPVQTPQSGLNPCLVPWWPDAYLLPTEANGWQIVPAFQQSYSEPIESATLLYNSFERFVHDGSFFRGVIPQDYYMKSAVHDRYVYAYSFGQKVEKGISNGSANWDKIPRKELYITMKKGRAGKPPPAMNLYVYTTIWNVFKVYGGRGGMLFSN